jgi:hypothetical protein
MLVDRSRRRGAGYWAAIRGVAVVTTIFAPLQLARVRRLCGQRVVGRHVRLRRVIVDKRATLPDGFQAGIDADADRARGFLVTDGGITLITQHIHEVR